MDKNKIKGHLAFLVANLIFGANVPVARMLMPDIMSPLALTFFRFSGGMLLFWLASLFYKREHVSLRDKALLFGASLLALTMNQLPFFIGLSKTSPIDASIVMTMSPIVTMLMAAYFIKEPITRKKALGVLVGATGAMIIVFKNATGGSDTGTLLGNIIVFSAVVSFAFYLTLFKGLISRYSPVTIMKWMFLYATITGLPFCYSSLRELDLSNFPPNVWLTIAFVVVMATFVAYLMLPIGQKVLRPTTLSMYNYIQPIMASMVAMWIGMDSFGYEQLVATVLVFSGVYIVTQSKSREQVEAEERRQEVSTKSRDMVDPQ